MKYREVFLTESTGRQRDGGRVILDNGKIRFEGLSKGIVDSMRVGARGADAIHGPSAFSPDKDPEKFFEVLPYEFSGSMIRVGMKVWEEGELQALADEALKNAFLEKNPDGSVTLDDDLEYF